MLGGLWYPMPPFLFVSGCTDAGYTFVVCGIIIERRKSIRKDG